MQRSCLRAATMICSLSLTLASSVLADMSSAPKDRMQKSGWHTNFSQAEAEAKALGKPLVVHFYADWCGPCQQMEHSVLNEPAVLRRLGKDVVGVKVNADHNPSIRSRFGVSGFPTDVMVSPAGKVDTRYVGATSESTYISRLEQLAAKYPGKPASEVADASRKSTRKNGPAIAAKPGAKHLGLEGYSPVALTTGKLWKKGQAEFEADYLGVTYRFVTREEQELFEADSARYAPRLLGCDPVILAEEGRAVKGKTRHGVFFRDQVFLLANEANRTEFLENPAYYADKQLAVEVDEIEQFVSR